MSVTDKLAFIRKRMGYSQAEFAERIGVSVNVIKNIEAGRTPPSFEYIQAVSKFTGVSAESIETGSVNTSSIKFTKKDEKAPTQQDVVKTPKVGPKKKIPLFDDVGSIGGINSTIAVDHGVVYPSELIDPGELFPGASAAIRHYSDSMVEYPSGCILFIQIIEPPYSFIWGEDYVVEYNGYRITKRLQRGKDEKHVRAYSTNTDTYPDGTPVHQPIDIAVAEIRHLYLVIGHIRKKYGSGLLRAAQ